jgi:hypothetical protein
MAQRLFGYSLSSTVIQQQAVISSPPVRCSKKPSRQYFIFNPVQYDCLSKKLDEQDYLQLYAHHRKH